MKTRENEDLESKGESNERKCRKLNKSQNEIAKEIGISKSYLSEILNGKKGCSHWLMKEILKYYPNLKNDFKLLNPRYIIRKGEINENNSI